MQATSESRSERMPRTEDDLRLDYEEVFRSLARLFDEQRLEDVLLLERDTGFLVTGLERGELPAAAAEPDHRFTYVERMYDHQQIAEASKLGKQQRGTGHRANRNEDAFRLLGRHVNQEGGSHVLILDQGDHFVVRMLVSATADMPHRFVAVGTLQLEQIRESALAERRLETTA
jgi:hypothetical protein